MKKIVLIIGSLLLSNNILCQRITSINQDAKYIDSLVVVVKTTKNDSIRSLCSFELVGLFKKENELKKMEEYLSIGKKYAKNFPFLRDCSGYYRALMFLNNDDLDSFAKEISETLKKIKKYNFYKSYKLQTLILQNLAVYHQIKGDKKEALQLLVDEAIPVTLKVGNDIMLANLYKMIGTIMINTSNREQADEYYKKSLELLKNQKSSDPFLEESIIELYIAAGVNLLNLGKLKEGRVLLDNAYSVLKKFPKSNLNTLYFKAEGDYFCKINEFGKALVYYEKGIEEVQNSKEFDVIELNNLKLGKFESLFKLKRYSKAKLELMDLIQNTGLTSNQKKEYSLKLSNTFQQLGDFKNAYLYAQSYIKLNDSIINKETTNEILLLEAKFNKSENEKKIIALEREKQNAELRAENNKLYYIIIGLFCVALMIFSFFLWRNNVYQKRLGLQKEINHIQSLENLQKEKDLEIMTAMIEGEEAERKRIARDLHDGIGSRLSSLKMQINYMESKSNDLVNIKIISNSLSSSISELRQIAFNLLPETLLKLGLELALKDLCHSLSNKKVSIVFLSNEIQYTIKETNQITIFRIVQELLNNALKHSNCSEIVVDCSQNENLFLITVEDNGIGFNTNDMDYFTGLGLKNIKNRVDLLKGKLEIKSTSNGGSIFNIELKV